MIEQINQISETWWRWMWPMLWQVSVVVALVWATDAVMRKRMWPQVRYALWLLVLLKLVLPPSLTLPTSITSELEPLARKTLRHQLFADEASTAVPTKEGGATMTTMSDRPHAKVIVDSDAAITAGAVGTAHTLDAEKASLCWRAYVMLGWLVGAALLAGWLVVRFRQLAGAHLRKGGMSELPEWFGELLADTAKTLKLRWLPRAILSDSIFSPAVFGAYKPVLLMPAENVTRLSPKETGHVLLHELAHIKRGDLWAHAMQMVLQIIYWFNPLVWVVGRQLQHLRELCCDATVARILREETDDYRETILQTARRLLARPPEPGVGLVGLFEDSSRLLTRLKWLEKKTWKHRPLRILTIFVLVCLMATCVLPMARGERSLKERIEADAARFLDYFPDDPEAAKQLDRLFEVWSERGVESTELGHSDKEILRIVRNGFRRTSEHRTLLLRMVGNRYIWGKSPQNEDAIELMYHASFSPDSNVRHYATYFGLSVVSPKKSGKILRRLSELCIYYDTTDIGRVAWGCRGQKDELVDLLIRYQRGSDAVISQRAKSAIQTIKPEGKAEEPQSEHQDVSKFRAALPNGVKVELVGVCEYPSKRCWRPDGSAIDEQIFATSGDAAPKDGDYGFMVKLDGPRDLNFKWRKIEGAGRWSGSCKVSDGQGDILDGFEAAISDMKEGQLSTTLRVGTAAGPWETIASHDGKSMNSGSRTGVLWSQAFESRDGTHIVASNEWCKDRAERIVVLDSEGVFHATHHGSVASGEVNQLTATFRNLKLRQIKEFRFQTRPYDWVEFKNVSLRPGLRTDFEFRVCGPEATDYSRVTVEEGVGFGDIIVGDLNCTGEFIKSKLGKPDKEVKDEVNWWLNYRGTYGLGFWVNPTENILIEIRLNEGFKGKLSSGVSMSSRKDDVFRVYGRPIEERTVRDFDKRFDNQVLFCRKGRLFGRPQIGKIYYDQHGLLFWFDGDEINQIVIHQKQKKSDLEVTRETAPAGPRNREGAVEERTRKEMTAARLANLRQQVDRVQAELDGAERTLEEVRERWGFTDLEERSYPHPVTSRLMRLELERDNCMLEIRQLEVKIKNLERRAETSEGAANLKQARDDLAVLAGKLEELEKMQEEAAARKRDLDLARIEYVRRLRVRDERKRALDALKSEVEKLKVAYDGPDLYEENVETGRR